MFATRWTTHFCAPVFSLLAGTGAFLQIAKGKSRRDVAAFLLSRGLFLMILDAAYISVVWQDQRLGFWLATLWALGAAMIGLGAPLFLPTRWIGIVAVAILCTHNLLDGIHAQDLGHWVFIWSFLHEVNEFRPSRVSTSSFNTRCSPGSGHGRWIFAGCGLPARAETSAAPARRSRPCNDGAVFVRRWSNPYGDPSQWSEQRTALFALLSFVRTTKYPPSLLFVLMTLGPALIAMALIEPLRLRAGNPLLVYGGTAMFFYVVHAAVLPLIVPLIAVQSHEVRFP